ncbi:hypothetical protein N7457_005300 [Penicillium paradoxum]|uniref:uncharacterized protein n=1 Tax=Penicillium paradoxum TaxID=176176 RepID=UPI002549823A|nr:uncharacterized protein N7457_005300 [Penicillium paradoxum]KAJ5780140.1 hypothetical protein N7457_005300 [Penicillium paradoxum]
MSRKVDQIPLPAEARQMKVIVASPSRSGTLGLYQAMRILGYNTYHIYECCAIHGLPHMKIFNEAVTASYNRLSGIRRYTPADFERWLGDYDCLVEVPSYIGVDFIEAYTKDPNVKFILTERKPEKWAASMNNTTATLVTMATTFPFNIIKYFDSTLYEFLDLNVLIYRAIAGGTYPRAPGNIEELCRFYRNYIKAVKEIIPADRLCLIQLEDGLDWEKICPFLGVPVPEQPYPGRNEPEKFKVMVEGFIQPKINAAIMRFSAVAISTVGVLGWAAVKYGPSALAALTGY